MEKFEQIYSQQLCTSVSLIQEISSQLAQQRGKKLRPMLTCLSAGACIGHVPDKKLYLAVALELLHNSSLIHDDVVDESDMRRGQPTVNHRWGNKIAVLTGDFYLANAMALLCQYASSDEMNIVNQTAVEMSEGELLQQQSSLRSDLSIQAYNATIYKKTASLLSACCQVGQWSEEGTAINMKKFGTHFGMAFQMRDDLLDYMPAAQTGKPYGNDLIEHKMTLPLIHYINRLGEHDAQHLMKMIESPMLGDEVVMQVIAGADNSGALEDTRRDINKEIDLAIEELAQLPQSEYKNSLVSLTESLRPELI